MIIPLFLLQQGLEINVYRGWDDMYEKQHSPSVDEKDEIVLH